MDKKIAEIKEKYTLLKGVAVEDESDTHTVWLVVGNQQFVLDNYWSEEEGEWMREMLAKAILALIASEQKPMVEALKEAQWIAEYCADMNKSGVYPELIAEELTEKLAELKCQIDAVLLKGEGK